MNNEISTLRREKSGNVFFGLVGVTILAIGFFFFSVIAAISLKLRKLKKTSTA